MVDRLRFHRVALLIAAGTVAVLVGSSSAMAQDHDESPGDRPARPGGGGPVVETAPDGQPMRAGSLIVKFQVGSDPAERDAAHLAAGAELVEPLFPPDIVRVQLPPGTTVHGLDAYRSSSVVEYAEPDYVRRFTPS